MIKAGEQAVPARAVLVVEFELDGPTSIEAVMRAVKGALPPDGVRVVDVCAGIHEVADHVMDVFS